MPRGFRSSEAKRRQREALFRAQSGLCKWCQQPMVLPDTSKVQRHRKLPWNLATIDHLDDRFSPYRGKRAGEYRRVLACKRCNEMRGRASQAVQPIEELRRRARNGESRKALKIGTLTLSGIRTTGG